MVVLVLLIVGLAIELWHLLTQLWPLALSVLVIGGAIRLGVALTLVRTAHTQEFRDHLRHEQARREIDRIAAETELAMYEAATQREEVIEGTAVEVKR